MINSEYRASFIETLIEWGATSDRSFPWRENPEPFDVLVAEILLQRTFAEKVAPIFESMMERYPSPHRLASADTDEIEDILRPLGLQRRKATALKNIGEQLIHSESVPDKEHELLELPSVGKYAANAVLCFGYDCPKPIVDANVVRIYNRCFSKSFADDRDTGAWRFAEEMLPDRYYHEYNLALLDLGAEICTSQNPSCQSCPVNGFCDYYDEQMAAGA